jgi:tRNA pseudouridine32 synthase / 23S rRNA pseudouridine746 synthase
MSFEEDLCFTPLNIDGLDISLPKKFTYPFNYQPHALCLRAYETLKPELDQLPHDFAKEENALGKMFGVLIVKDKDQRLGFLKAFSGKLFGGNKVKGYVPPVFDTLDPEGFYKKGEEEIVKISIKLDQLNSERQYNNLLVELSKAEEEHKKIIQEAKHSLKERKEIRKQKRLSLNSLDTLESLAVETALNHESARDHYILKDLNRQWNTQLASIKSALAPYEAKIEELKNLRRSMSAALQDLLFDNYKFLNCQDNEVSLKDIFEITDEKIPPSGAGECAAPKLLQYAFLNKMMPISMAEFWWGKSPQSEIRKHGQFYPACRSKCLPILNHMLIGIEVEPNPMLADQKAINLDILYEDDEMIVVNKPSGLLSVPGKTSLPSVQSMLAEKYGEIMMVHRLDMSTSGIIIAAKSMPVYHQLQAQFISRKVVKKYEALLEGIPSLKEGTIILPIRVDLDNRPRQLVDEVHGKYAKTHYKVNAEINGRALVDFYPVTGRTHQLRVHAAHQLGLGLPIVGDDLYGNRAERLYLHAAYLRFTHPTSGRMMEIRCESGFWELDGGETV